MTETQLIGLCLLTIVALVVWYAFRRGSGVKPTSDPPPPSDQGGTYDSDGGGK